MSGKALAVKLDSPLPRSVPRGSATAVFCMGTASEGSAPVADLELLVDGIGYPLEAVRMTRFDMPCRRSGFWGLVPFVGSASAEHVELSARVRGRDGAVEEVELGAVPIVDEPQPAGRGDRDALIAVCMATFDPDPALLARQLDSLRSQTDARWTCVISDDHSSPERYATLTAMIGEDARFIASRSERRIGFYRNFERALRMAPPEAQLIAFCDQDDVWHPDKLAVLRGAIGSASLVYCDQRLVDTAGRVLRKTLWQGRANNSTNLASMLIANTVTGAAALFRQDVAERALPFPDSPGIEFHDHWIALVALAGGELRYVDRPLYDYVQHEGAILGKVAGQDGPADAGAGLGRLPRMRRWRAAYFLGYVPGKVRAETLLLRCGERMAPAKRRALERYISSEHSLLGFAWLLLRPARALIGRNETLAAEWELTRGIAWQRLARASARAPWPGRWTLDTRFPDPPHFQYRRLQRWRGRM